MAEDPVEVWQAAADLKLPVDDLLDWVARQADNLIERPAEPALSGDGADT